MHQSKIGISTKSGSELERFFIGICASQEFVYCRALRRKISLEKLPQSITLRKQSSTWRMKRFIVALDILQFSRSYTKRVHNNLVEFELMWLDKMWKKVVIHLREEYTRWKDKIVYFISCY